MTMKKIIFFYLLLVPAFLVAQNKYLIYFKDKAVPMSKTLNKKSIAYQQALQTLSAKCIRRREKVMGNNIIMYADIPVKPDYINAVEKLGITIENKLNWFNAVSAYLSDSQLKEVTSLPFVEKVDPVKTLSFSRSTSLEKITPAKTENISTDTLYGPSYTEMNLCDIPEVQAKGITGKGITIGILDDGFKWRQHESLVNQDVIAEYNFVFHDSSTSPQPGDIQSSGNHGTYVFSLIGGYKPGEIIGVAHDAKFILAKTEDDRSESHIEEDNYAAALEWMEGLGVDITTSSLGYSIFDDTTYSYTYQDMDGKTTICAKAVELAYQRGVVTVSAAGNDGENSWHYIETPGDGIHILTIGAVDSTNTLAPFSSRGPTYDGRIKPDIVAMGSNNYGASVANGFSAYGIGSGTSFATPIAAGVAALLLSAYPELTNAQVRDILRVTAGNNSAPDNNIGYGLVSAEKAVAYPNLYYDSTNNQYTLTKIFFPNNGIESQTAALHYSVNSSSFSNIILSYDGILKYSYKLPQIPIGELVEFYYSYKDTLGNIFNEPASGYFEFYSGNNMLNLIGDTSVPVFQNVLGNCYPNPFTPYGSQSHFIKIPFKSGAIQHAKLIIINSVGQIVKTLFDGQAQLGLNTILWDGRLSDGKMAASGVYFDILFLGSKNYNSKFVLLK